MTDLRDLYQEVILDHNKSPHNTARWRTRRIALGHNPLCGDDRKLVSWTGIGSQTSRVPRARAAHDLQGVRVARMRTP